MVSGGGGRRARWSALLRSLFSLDRNAEAPGGGGSSLRSRRIRLLRPREPGFEIAFSESGGPPYQLATTGLRGFRRSLPDRSGIVDRMIFEPTFPVSIRASFGPALNGVIRSVAIANQPAVLLYQFCVSVLHRVFLCSIYLHFASQRSNGYRLAGNTACSFAVHGNGADQSFALSRISITSARVAQVESGHRRISSAQI